MNRDQPCEMCGERRAYHTGPHESMSADHEGRGGCLGFCPSDNCPYCTGADCIRHGSTPCDCDVIDRHEWDIEDDDTPADEGRAWSPLTIAALVLTIVLGVGIVAGAIYAFTHAEDFEPVSDLPTPFAPLLAVETTVTYDDLCVITETVLVYYGGGRAWAGRKLEALAPNTPRDVWPCDDIASSYDDVDRPHQYINYHDGRVTVGNVQVGQVTWSSAELSPRHHVSYLSDTVEPGPGFEDEEITR